MNYKKNKIILITMITLLLGSIIIWNTFNKSNKEDITFKNNFQKILSYKENGTSYNTKDGIHNIYWAQGITPPIMTNDDNLLGKDGYFDLEVIGNFSTYTAEFKPNNGYYDYNKNLDSRYDEHPLCYLGAASNLLSWWLEQNKEYVNEYKRRLRETDIYGQDPSLHSLKPYDNNMWNEIIAPPVLELQNGYLAEKLGTSPLVTKHLKPYYYKKDDGYAADVVLDFFFNGYDAIPTIDMPPENNENNFKKDPRGGFFYPLLNKERLTDRITGTNITSVDNLGRNLRKYFREGKGVILGYLVNPHEAHALTVWGAEYDNSGKLIRIYVTDSDDYQPVHANDKYWRGLVGMNVVPDSNGVVTLTNQKEYNPTKPGVYLIHLMTLDLAKDRLETRLKDINAPLKPVIKSEPTDKVTALNAIMTFEVQVTKPDNGYLEYIWYEADNISDKGKKIFNSNSNKINVKAEKLGSKYYYCEVINVKNGKQAISSTKHFKVDVKNVELKNAETPNLTFNYNTVTYNQYDTPKEIRVSAYVNDGGTLTYQWYQTNTSEAINGTKLLGETKSYLIPPTDKITNGLYYYCIVTNTNPSLTGNTVASATTRFAKRIKVVEKIIYEAEKPSIIKQPVGATVHKDTPLNLEIDAISSDNGIISYEWYEVKSGNDISLGVKSKVFSPNTTDIGKRYYKVKVTNTNKFAKNVQEKSIFSDLVTVEVKEKEVILSSDNELKSLVVKNGTLTPKFNKNIKNYKVTIPHDHDKLNFDTKINNKAKITIENPTLKYGESKNVTIKVIAENGKENTYIIKVTKDKNHTYGNWKTVIIPTCTKNGLEERICPFDGYKETRTIPKLGHDFQESWTFEKLPTETSEGIKYHKCKRCNEKKDITIVPKLNNHIKCTFSDWEIIKKPTCTEKGIEERTCQICGKKELKEINALGHDFKEEWTFDKLPTEFETGIKSHHCKRCNQIKDETIVPKLDVSHDKCTFGDWIIIKKPTYEENGLKKKICNICGKELTEIIPKLEKPNNDNKPKNKYIIIMTSIIITLSIGIIITIIFKLKRRKI